MDPRTGAKRFEQGAGPGAITMEFLVESIWEQIRVADLHPGGLRKLKVSWYDILNETTFPSAHLTLDTFRDELNSRLVASKWFEMVNDRYVRSAMQQINLTDHTRLAVPAIRQNFDAVMDHQQSSVDVILLARLRSATEGHNAVRYQLTLELVQLLPGNAGAVIDQFTAHVTKGNPW